MKAIFGNGRWQVSDIPYPTIPIEEWYEIRIMKNFIDYFTHIFLGFKDYFTIKYEL